MCNIYLKKQILQEQNSTKLFGISSKRNNLFFLVFEASIEEEAIFKIFYKKKFYIRLDRNELLTGLMMVVGEIIAEKRKKVINWPLNAFQKYRYKCEKLLQIQSFSFGK